MTVKRTQRLKPLLSGAPLVAGNGGGARRGGGRFFHVCRGSAHTYDPVFLDSLKTLLQAVPRLQLMSKAIAAICNMFAKVANRVS
jgi:hypothetical protein